jgi:HAD superfamily hydrolase (TIGR01509 family)
MTTSAHRPPLTVQGMILDNDGTLVLSNDAHARAWQEALNAFGHDIPYEAIRQLVGMGGDQLLPRLVPGLTADSPEGQRIAERRKTIFMQHYLPQLVAAPGARDLVIALQQRGMRLLVGSSAKADELDALLRVAGVADVLPDRTTAADAQHTKPAPDLVQVAIERLGLPTAQIAMLGDSPYDLQAAQQAGIPLVAVRCGGFSDADLAGAYAIYDDPQDVLHALDDLFGPKPVGPTTDAAREHAPTIQGDEASPI